VDAIWQGDSPDGSEPLEVVDGPPQGGDLAHLVGISAAFAPEYEPEEVYEIAQKALQEGDGLIAHPLWTPAAGR
jgi:Mn-containing catalase